MIEFRCLFFICLFFSLQGGYRSDWFGRHGSESDPEHGRPRLRRVRLQPHHVQSGRLSAARGQGQEHRRRPLAGRTGRQTQETAPRHDARQRFLSFVVRSFLGA